MWSCVVVPFLVVILRPFVHLDSKMCGHHTIYAILGVKHQITGEKLIDRGFILPNHRSWMDFALDSYTSNGTMISRSLVILAIPFLCLLNYIDNRIIFIRLGKESRNDIYRRMVSHINRYQNKRIVFYPEGSRNNYTSLKSCEELKSYIKFGLLKSIYEDKLYPVQLMISNNKEFAINEKKLTVNYGVKIHTKISKAIHPKDYATDVAFFDEIVRVWFDCYVETHSHQ